MLKICGPRAILKGLKASRFARFCWADEVISENHLIGPRKNWEVRRSNRAVRGRTFFSARFLFNILKICGPRAFLKGFIGFKAALRGSVEVRGRFMEHLREPPRKLSHTSECVGP